jgi:hypothetical protein
MCKEFHYTTNGMDRVVGDSKSAGDQLDSQRCQPFEADGERERYFGEYGSADEERL